MLALHHTITRFTNTISRRIGADSNYVAHFWRKSALVFSFLLAGKCIALVWKLWLAKLGPESIGSVQLVLAISTLLANFSTLGWQTTLVRFISFYPKVNANRLTEFVLKFGLSVWAAMIVPLLLFPSVSLTLFNQTSHSPLFIATYLLGGLFIITEVYTEYFNGLQQTNMYGVLKFLVQPLSRLICLAVFIVFVSRIPIPVSFHVFIAGISATLVSVWLFIKYRKTISSASIDWKKFAVYSTPISLSYLSYITFTSLDVLLLGKFTSLYQVGLFAGMLVLTDIFDIVFLPILNTMQAYLTKYKRQQKQGLLFVLSNSLLLGIVGLGSTTFILMFREQLTHYLLSNQFLIPTNILALLLLIKLAHNTITLPLRHYLDYYGHSTQTFILMAMALFTKLVSGVLLIPSLGIMGVVVAQLLAESIHILGCVSCTVFTSIKSKHK